MPDTADAILIWNAVYILPMTSHIGGINREGKKIALQHYKRQSVSDEQKRTLAATQEYVQEKLEGDFIKSSTWELNEERVLYFPLSFNELPQKYPDRYPSSFKQGMILERKKYQSDETQLKAVFIACDLSSNNPTKEKEWTPPPRTCKKLSDKLSSGYNVLACTKIGEGQKTDFDVVKYVPDDEDDEQRQNEKLERLG